MSTRKAQNACVPIIVTVLVAALFFMVLAMLALLLEGNSQDYRKLILFFLKSAGVTSAIAIGGILLRFVCTKTHAAQEEDTPVDSTHHR